MKKHLIMSLLILSLVFSMSACGKTTSEKAAEKAQKELELSDDETAELKEVYDEVLEDDAADTTKQSEPESSEEVKELKSYELKDEVKNADASELLFQVDDIVLKLDGSMTFHDVITAFESNEENYIWKEVDTDNVFDNPEDAESALIGANKMRAFKLCKVVSEESDALEIVWLKFLNPTDDAVITSASLLAGIVVAGAPWRSDAAAYYVWFPGGISLADTSSLTWDNAAEVLEKAGYTKTKEPDFEEDGIMTTSQAFTDCVPAFYCKDSGKLCYSFYLQNQYNQQMAFNKMAFKIDFSEEAAKLGLGSPVIDNN